MKNSKKNIELATEAFQEYFKSRPQELLEFMEIIFKILEEDHHILQQKIANRYLKVFSQLCEIYGFYELKLKLDDTAFSIELPQKYSFLLQQVKKYQEDSDTIIEEIKQKLEASLTDFPNILIEGRFKNVFSIYKKCQKQFKNFEQEQYCNLDSLGDIFAFRVIIDDKPELCFDVVNTLQNTFYPIAQRYKDYISIPKINGYQSIHIGLQGIVSSLDLIVEVQVRTKLMHDYSVYGSASHALYSRNKHSELLTEKEEKLLSSIYSKESDYIYCLTIRRDIIKIEKQKNTIQEIGKRIHSDFMKTVKAGILNGKKVDLTEKVENFDIIKLIQ